METVSPHYQDVLDHLAETLRKERQAQFLGQLASPAVAIPLQSHLLNVPGMRPSPDVHTGLVA